MTRISPHLFRTCVEVGVKKKNKSDYIWLGSGILFGSDFLQLLEGQGRFVMPYLFTNKHVIDRIADKLESKSIAIRLLNKTTGNSEIHTTELLDPDDGMKLWAVHPNPEVDVAAISMDTPSENVNFDLAEVGEMMTVEIMKLHGCTEGDGVFVVGYPYSLRGLSPGTRAHPLVRSGCISRISDTFGGLSQTFLIDATVYPGNSGGPVLLEPSHDIQHLQGTYGCPKSALIGMISGYLEYDDEAVSIQSDRTRIVFTENSGISKVETVDKMFETLALLREQMKDKFPKNQPPYLTRMVP